MSAALPGVVASMTTLPVIGVPLAGSHLSGVDSLHAIVQMPPGVPVATMAIGAAGAKNAAIFAVQILGLSDAEIESRIDDYKAELAAG
jgi:phosphoribosylaminoimidazole carboxylase PurE protein